MNSVLVGMDHFDSRPGFRNLTQTHLLKPSELTQKLPLDVVEASIPVLSCGVTNGSTCADHADGYQTMGLRFVRFGLLV